MPDAAGEVLATRVAFLELSDERRLVREGYELLDEKRMLLASEIMRQLKRLAALREERERLEAALLRTDVQTFLGLHLVDAVIEEPQDAAPDRPTLPTPEARACEAAFHRLLLIEAPIAACVGNLRRLVREYVRTERRARALENVMLPEIDGSLKFIEEQLDALDQEEAIRVRNAAHA